MKTLHIKKGAPETIPPFYSGFAYDPETTCISYNLWYLERGPDYHGKCRCNSRGTIKTDRGLLCTVHARVYARRGWINPNLLREILIEMAEAKAVKARIRLACLRQGKCI